MIIVITGGSGFIGTNLVQYLIDNYSTYKIYNIDHLPPKNKNHNEYWINININDSLILNNFILETKPDYIVHLAARTDLNEKNDIEGYNANILGVKNIMDSASKLPSLKRIIIASSMLVNKVGYIPHTYTDYNPNTLYGKSKVLTEQIVHKYDLNWVLIRPTSIWGPWFGEPYNNFFKLVIKGYYVNLPKNKAAIKTYGYIENSCLQIVSLLFNENQNILKNTFYIGDSPPLNISEWSNEIRKSIQKQNLPTIPFLLFKFLCQLGSFFKNVLKLKKIPLDMFRFKNMTTNNIIITEINKTNSFLINDLNKNLNYQIQQTIFWLNTQN